MGTEMVSRDLVRIEGNSSLFQKTRWAFKQGHVIKNTALFVGLERSAAPLACLSRCVLLEREAYEFQVSSGQAEISFVINPVQNNRFFQAADFVGQVMFGSENITFECHRNSRDSEIVCATRRCRMIVCWESQTRYVYLTDCAQKNGVKLVELVDWEYRNMGLDEIFRSKFGFGRNCIGRFLPGYLSMEEKHQDLDMLGLLCTTIWVHQVVADDNIFVRR